MPTRLPTSSRMDPEFRPTRAALRKRPSGRSRLQQDDPSTISSPAQAAADPDKAGRPRSDRNPHNHSPPTLTSTRVQISVPLWCLSAPVVLDRCDSAIAELRPCAALVLMVQCESASTANVLAPL